MFTFIYVSISKFEEKLPVSYPFLTPRDEGTFVMFVQKEQQSYGKGPFSEKTTPQTNLKK